MLGWDTWCEVLHGNCMLLVVNDKQGQKDKNENWPQWSNANTGGETELRGIQIEIFNRSTQICFKEM